jgi:hypothetical protein
MASAGSALGPPGIPANTFKWPWLRFVASRSVHILYSELKPPQQAGHQLLRSGLQAYGYTLTEAIVHAWRGNSWHVDMSSTVLTTARGMTSTSSSHRQNRARPSRRCGAMASRGSSNSPSHAKRERRDVWVA